MYSLFTNCKVVKGFLRAIIYDLQKNDYHLVPLEIEDVLRSPITPFDAKITENLLVADVIFPSSLPGSNHFEDMNLAFSHPSHISNVVCRVANESPIREIVALLETLRCYNVQFIIEDECDFEIGPLLFLISVSSFKHVELVISFPMSEKLITATNWSAHPEIRTIFIYKAPTPEISQLDAQHLLIIKSTQHDINGSPPKNESLFIVNVFMYTESLKFNTFYHKKLFIDKFGSLMPALDSTTTYGNVLQSNQDTLSLIQSHRFSRLAHITKEEIFVCNVCEFRHMCVDSRIPRPAKHGKWYHDTECNYNPFIAKWEHESGFRGLEESGITVNMYGIQINNEVLDRVLSLIYEVEELSVL